MLWGKTHHGDLEPFLQKPMLQLNESFIFSLISTIQTIGAINMSENHFISNLQFFNVVDKKASIVHTNSTNIFFAEKKFF